MRLFDLHCDTLYKALTTNKSFREKDFHISVDRGMKFDKWIQCMAIWIPDEIRGEEAVQLFKSAYQKLLSECEYNKIDIIKSKKDLERSKKASFIFTVENAAALGGKIENVQLFKKLGVKLVTLTWNGSNEIGDGCKVEKPKGLTKFGKKVINEFVKNDIYVDLSHASDKLFFDVAEMISDKPIIATHSNSRTVTNNLRNLTDEQFLIIKNSKGIVGLNFYKEFLNSNSDKASMSDIIKHADYFLSLGGEDVLCLGSDFDGADMPQDINGIEKMFDLYELFLKEGYSETLVRKIFYDNAYKFCENFDNS